jgi:hypothetical protein
MKKVILVVSMVLTLSALGMAGCYFHGDGFREHRWHDRRW